MLRNISNDLILWKLNKKRKPLLVLGARQVGKTWILNEFGKQQYEQIVYLNFESSERLQDLFSPDFDIKRIIAAIEIEVNFTIYPEKALIIFDEIQEAKKGLTALKYFNENGSQYHVIAAGSLLGVSVSQNSSFPVGKVDFLRMYPLSFFEFLENIGQSILLGHIQAKNWAVVNTFHDKLIEFLRIYYFTGGMPEAVEMYIETGNLQEVRAIQKKLLDGYQNDFSKYAPVDLIPKIRLVWQSIVPQLAKENKKFIFGHLKKGSRAKDFENALFWLLDAGLVFKASHVEKPAIPLLSYSNSDVFKLFFVDIGLLNAMAEILPQILLDKNKILTEFKGALTEQYVAQQLKEQIDLYYWSAANGMAEIDFLIQKDAQIIPLEVKAEENLKAKSLKSYLDKFPSPKALRISMSKHREQDWLENVPLYGVGTVLS